MKELLDYTGQLLQPTQFQDYCPNGLQVAGKPMVSKVVTGVTASMALLEAAQAAGADAILVHHGYFWRGEDACIRGIKKARLKFLLAHDINLLAYHLPLDAHAEFGNNMQLGQHLGLQGISLGSGQSMLATGDLLLPQTLADFCLEIGRRLGRAPQVIGDVGREIRRVAWCTGAAQGFFEQAIALGVDAYISGEISEPTVHLARESGVAYIAAGHHATERYGVQALGAELARRYELEHQFIDIDNPV
ncbi:Nif3-like dinuclear metal center hexameric protein [Pseudomethylobacillus aquaticus]|uniref:Nif3-like dinuclear metal center hexameric protein n=1 Tax=Pseudomethylobacillus aquaticus TaxID=2676064 RepID=UPI00187B9494